MTEAKNRQEELRIELEAANSKSEDTQKLINQFNTEISQIEKEKSILISSLEVANTSIKQLQGQVDHYQLEQKNTIDRLTKEVANKEKELAI
jgi:chromosome segregation ATPase